MNAPREVQAHSPAETCPPSRLRWGQDEPGRASLDGAWWPRSRDLGTELADLYASFPAHLGHPRRVLVSRSDWDTHVRRVPVADGHLEAGPLPRPDPHVAVVLLPRGQQVRLLLVPPDFSEYHAAEAMLAACTRGNTHTAAQLLAEVVDQPDDDPWQVWS